MEQIALNWGPQRSIFTVSDLTARIRALLDSEFGNVWVSGEISGARPAASGHIYFTLKDATAQLKCVAWRSTARYLKFKPQDGIAVIARGRIDLFEARGEYQLIVDSLEPQGHGALQLAFEQLKRKLAAEGLFDAARKRALPRLPRRIGIITSPAGAVIQDMLNVLGRRFPGLHIRLFPAVVQGEGSVESVCRGLEFFTQDEWAEVVILARGGGSLEDLWTFNEEAVARAIAASRAPVISAIGHETDFSISDFVADLRAPTPSAAAELVICTREQLLDSIAGCDRQLDRAIRYALSEKARRVQELGTTRAEALLHRRIGRGLQRVDELDYCLRDHFRGAARRAGQRCREAEERLRRFDLRLRFADGRARLAAAKDRAERCLQSRLERAHARLEGLRAQLQHLSPTAVLDRGYAIVQKEDGSVVFDPVEVAPGGHLEIRVARGTFSATADPRQ